MRHGTETNSSLCQDNESTPFLRSTRWTRTAICVASPDVRERSAFRLRRIAHQIGHNGVEPYALQPKQVGGNQPYMVAKDLGNDGSILGPHFVRLMSFVMLICGLCDRKLNG